MFYHLHSRCLLRVHGPDAGEFLQNILTNDIRRITSDAPLQYNLLLIPQGQILHEMFVVWQAEGDYLIDIYQPRKADLLRRLTLFRLRAKVSIAEIDEEKGGVFARLPDAIGEIDMHHQWLADPRTTRLGQRLYTTTGDFPRASEEYHYTDFSIDEGVVTPEGMRFEKDFVHDLGLDQLNAIAWDKGCFIGQEVAARVEHRGLAKKGLYKLAGEERLDIAAPVLSRDEGLEAGEIRQCRRDGRVGLALLKKMVVEMAPSFTNGGHLVKILP